MHAKMFLPVSGLTLVLKDHFKLSNSRSRNDPKLTIKPRVDHSGNCEKKQCCCRLKHLQTSHVLIQLMEQEVHSSPSAIKRPSLFSIAKMLIYKVK